VHGLEIAFRLPRGLEHQRGSDPGDANSLWGEGTCSELGEARQALFRQGVAEEVRVWCRELGVQQIDDEPVGPGLMACGKRLRQEYRRAEIDRHVSFELVRAESPETVFGKARGVIDQEAYGRLSGHGRKDRFRAVRVLKLGNDLYRSFRDLIAFTMHVSDHRPAIGDQPGGNFRANSLAGACDDGGTLTPIHGAPVVIARAPKQGQPMPETRPPIELQGLSLSELQTMIDERHLPPVDKWNPERCGDSEMRIARDGTWYHQGAPITRAAMVRLFSTVLRREPDGSHVLVTPVEKLGIEVESTAFRAVEMETSGEGRDRKIALKLDSGDAVIVGADHPLTLVEGDYGPSPRVIVRHGLEAELSRPIYYELADIAVAEGADPPGIWSDGVFFPLGSE